MQKYIKFVCKLSISVTVNVSYSVLIYVFLQEMWDQEKKHLSKFNEILADSRVRPTALLPLWNIAGFMLGWCSS